MLASEASSEVLLLLPSLSQSHCGWWHAQRGARLYVGCDDGLLSAGGGLLWCFYWKHLVGLQVWNDGGRGTLCKHLDPNHIIGHFDVYFIEAGVDACAIRLAILVVWRQFVLYGGHYSQWRRNGAPCINRAPGGQVCWHSGHAPCTLQGRSGALEPPCYLPVALGRCQTWRMCMGRSVGKYL